MLKQRLVTFNSSGRDKTSGVCTWRNLEEVAVQSPDLNYPNTTRAAPLYFSDGREKMRAISTTGNLWEVDLNTGTEKQLRDSWNDCESVTLYRDCTVVVNKHIFLVNPDDVHCQLDAGSDWSRNQGCGMLGEDLYIGSSSGNLWCVPLKGWSDQKLTPKKVATGESVRFVATDPVRNKVYVGTRGNIKVYDPATDSYEDLLVTVPGSSIPSAISNFDRHIGVVAINQENNSSVLYTLSVSITATRVYQTSWGGIDGYGTDVATNIKGVHGIGVF